MFVSAESKQTYSAFAEIFKIARKKSNPATFNNTSLPEENKITAVPIYKKAIITFLLIISIIICLKERKFSEAQENKRPF